MMKLLADRLRKFQNRSVQFTTPRFYTFYWL